jgi:hypothetical protein
MIKNLFYIYLIINIAIVSICFFTQNYSAIINIQIAFISSLFISTATFLSYQKNVNIAVKSKTLKNNIDFDCIDKINDPYDLYIDGINDELVINPTKEQIQKAMKPIKQNHINNLKNTLLTYTSFYRIGAYIILIIGFFYLNNNKLLEIIPYLLGFLIVPIGSLLSKNRLNENMGE